MGREGKCGRGLLNGVDELDGFFCVFDLGTLGSYGGGVWVLD